MTARIAEFELIDHGIENSQYFQGCGTAFTSFEHCATGIGNNPAEALDDLLDMVAQQGFDVEGMESRILADIGRKRMPAKPSVPQDSGDCYYHLSLRWNHAHEFGAPELSRLAGTLHRKCLHCKFVSLDMEDDE
jgi:hypothetical protein